MEGKLRADRQGNNVVTKNLFCATVLVFGATALRADVFTFSYAGAGLSATGTITATKLALGVYEVTNITGTRTETGDGTQSITNSLLGDGTFNYGSSPLVLLLK